MSHMHFVTAQCHNVTISQYHNVTMSQCHNVTMSQCHNITMSQYHNVTISQCRNVTMSPVHRYQQWTASQQCWLHIPSGGKSEPSSKYFHIDPFLTLVCNIAYCNAEDICICCQLCCRPENPPSRAVQDLLIRSNFVPQQPEIFHLAEDCVSYQGIWRRTHVYVYIYVYVYVSYQGIWRGLNVWRWRGGSLGLDRE